MTIGIRGMGLIGGSFEKAFRRVGHDVLNLKNVSPADIRSCALVVVCLPPRMVAPWVVEHAADFADDALVTDAAGVKGIVCGALADLAKSAAWTYVGGHPMAGRERSGYANSTPDLFQGASMIFTPYAWTSETDPARHDEMIAYTSQLAHVVSSAYVRDSLAAEHAGFSAGSFQDMTRVATVDPDMWTELFLSNRENLDRVLARLIARLSEYHEALRASDAPALNALLAEGRRAKEQSR